jgi:putative transcriptional regulator
LFRELGLLYLDADDRQIKVWVKAGALLNIEQ